MPYMVQNEVLPPLAVTQAADRLAVHLDVGHDVDFGHALDEAAAVLLDRRPVEVAEPAAECDQLVIVQRLAAHQKHRMRVPGTDHLRERGVVEIPEIDAPHLCAERPTSRNDLDCMGNPMSLRRGFNAQGHGFLRLWAHMHGKAGAVGIIASGVGAANHAAAGPRRRSRSSK
jgi:hypothetical protein